MADQEPFVGTRALAEYKREFPDAELTPAMEHMIVLEGFSKTEYLDTKDKRTIGVGLTGEYFPKPDETLHDAFMRAYADKEATARDLFPEYNDFSPELQTQIMSGVYRGDFKQGYNTVDAIKRGDFTEAGRQFLLNPTGNDFSKDYKEARRTGSGVKRRLEAIRDALLAEGRLIEMPEFAEEQPSSSGQASQAEPTRDSFATAEATADQMERLRKEKIAQDLIKDEVGLRNNLTPEEKKLISTNQRFAFDERGVSRLQKGGTPMASEQENDEMIQIGLVQDPNDTDPVSGNEIPLGATAEGVRDDEVAAISPGEFVVPQYAVNYHGLDFYMDSLNTAKQGLRQMDRMGMTGRPDEATLPDDMALPTMEEETTPILDRPIDTEMFMRGGLQTPVHSFANGGLVQYQTGGTYTTPTGLNVPTPTVATPTVQTPTAAPGAQVAAAPQQPGQMFYSPMPATPMPMQMPAVPQVQPGAPTISYPDYQGITGGQFGGYKLQEYKHKDTGNSIFLTLVGGKLPPGVTVPPGYIPVEEYNQQQEQEPATPTTPTAPTIDRGGPPTAFDLEMEQQQFEEEQAGQVQEKIDARKAAIGNALARAGTVPAAAQDAIEGADLDIYSVDPKHGMFIDGKFVTDARVLQQYADSTRRAIYTEDHPLGRFGAAVGKYIEGTTAFNAAQAVARAGKDLLDGVFGTLTSKPTAAQLTRLANEARAGERADYEAMLNDLAVRAAEEEAAAADAGTTSAETPGSAGTGVPYQGDFQGVAGSERGVAGSERGVDGVPYTGDFQGTAARTGQAQAAAASATRAQAQAGRDAADTASQINPASARARRADAEERARNQAAAMAEEAAKEREANRRDQAEAQQRAVDRARDAADAAETPFVPYAAGGLVKKKNKRRNGKGLARR
tara:strand:- start:1886 stop:4588 length:2703 start_codon:yes stop_codon:yes gene_type:complete